MGGEIKKGVGLGNWVKTTYTDCGTDNCPAGVKKRVEGLAPILHKIGETKQKLSKDIIIFSKEKDIGKSEQ